MTANFRFERSSFATAFVWLTVLTALMALDACKPESEPDWPYGKAPGASPDVALAVAPRVDLADTASPNADLSDTVSTHSDAMALGGDTGRGDVAETAGGDTGASSLSSLTLSEEDLVALRRPVTAADRQAAGAETRTGSTLHARMRLREALEHYRAALLRMPSHAQANYAAARAFALLGERDEALRSLLKLEAIGTESAKEKLAAARAEPDFASLRGEPTFRRLTGFGAVGLVIRAPGVVDNSQREATRQELLGHLLDVGYPAESVAETVVGDAKAPAVYYRGDHRALAKKIAHALGGARVRSATTDWGERPLDVVVVWNAGAPAPSSPDASLKTLMDLRLQARDGDGLRLLLLRSTGFFESEDRAAGGEQVRRRRGRYRVEGGRILMTFDETLERYPEGAEFPEITKKQGEKSVEFEVGPGRQVVVDGVGYRPVTGG